MSSTLRSPRDAGDGPSLSPPSLRWGGSEGTATWGSPVGLMSRSLTPSIFRRCGSVGILIAWAIDCVFASAYFFFLYAILSDMTIFFTFYLFFTFYI